MTISVLLADDSEVIRFLFSKALERDPEIHIVGAANDGVQALALTKQHKPDVVILDIEMPNMDGLTALPLIQQASPKTKIIIVSGTSSKDAAVTLKALAMGASECILKPGAAGALPPNEFHDVLRGTIKLLMVSNSIREHIAPSTPIPQTTIKIVKPVAPNIPVRAIAIASSTGGPAALIKLFEGMRGKMPHVPIFITQHMPAGFTSVLAEHLAVASGSNAFEGYEGQVVSTGIYVAPGGYHMEIKNEGGRHVVKLNQGPMVNSCRPSADPMFTSIGEAYNGQVLAVVLTGIGSDGTNGAKAIAARSGRIIAQDAATSVVYGMPRYVAEAGICEAILPLDKMADYILKNT